MSKACPKCEDSILAIKLHASILLAEASRYIEKFPVGSDARDKITKIRDGILAQLQEIAEIDNDTR